MKIKFKFLLIVGFTALFLVSCEKTMYVDLPGDKTKIVMNGILSPESGLWLNVSESVSATTPVANSFIPITDATVDYYQNDILITSIIDNNTGNYSETDFIPLVNNEYKIIVNAPGLPEARAVVTVPDPVKILDFDTTTVIRKFDIYNSIHYEVDFFVNFSIEDPDTIFNHYMLGIYYLENDAYHPLQGETDDINMNIYIKDGIEVLAWDDQNFNGQTTEFTVKFNMNYYEGFKTVFLVTLYSIEEDYFKYLKSYSQNFTVLNDDPLLFEAVQVSSNINNGYGIIAAVSSSSFSFYYSF